MIGIPTIIRDFKNETISYLERTLNAFVNPLSEEEKTRIQFNIFLTDSLPSKRQIIIERIRKIYHLELREGLINIVGIPSRFYKNLNDLPKTYNDGSTRVYWRSKQALDYTFIFSYVHTLCDYYMQTEDDAIPKSNYFQTVTNSILFSKKESIKRNKIMPWGHNVESWLCMEFYGMGYIGVVFPAHNLPFMIVLSQTFYWSIPVDLALQHISHSFHFISFKPEVLFTHIGDKSSSTGT